LCTEKIPLGVTVRSIRFIDDASISTGAHPLYAVLISREIEADQSGLNDDGLTPEEKKRQKETKDAEKVKRQVEADLGGFDVEQEWVEEIEREDCFEVDMSLGGAPPIQKRAYALWVVDASNSWSVVDSHELGEFDHAMTMEVLSLTEVCSSSRCTNLLALHVSFSDNSSSLGQRGTRGNEFQGHWGRQCITFSVHCCGNGST